MTPSEELVYKLSRRSFLSFWSYANPQGKNAGKELCDILVICDPDVIIFSVKEIEYRDTGRYEIDVERWRRKAIDESTKQIYGAERWINSNPNVITDNGETGLPFPLAQTRKIHRVAVALGSQGKVPLYLGRAEKGFVHVLDEKSLEILMNELDTISDFVKYLSDKEQFFQREILTIISGGEEDLLALYLSQNREFPSDIDTLILDDDLWSGFSKESTFLAKKQSDEVSYIWDTVIEEIYQNYAAANYRTDIPFAFNKLSDLEKAIRSMARENRFARRSLATNLVNFLEDNRDKKVRSRLCNTSVSDVIYVFLVSDFAAQRELNFMELYSRCIVARGLFKDKKTVIGILVEFSAKVEGSTTNICYVDIPEWTEELQEKMNIIQKELGYFTGEGKRNTGDYEYPPISEK